MMRCRIIFTLTVYINFWVMNDDIDGSVTHYEYYYGPKVDAGGGADQGAH